MIQSPPFTRSQLDDTSLSSVNSGYSGRDELPPPPPLLVNNNHTTNVENGSIMQQQQFQGLNNSYRQMNQESVGVVLDSSPNRNNSSTLNNNYSRKQCNMSVGGGNAQSNFQERNNESRFGLSLNSKYLAMNKKEDEFHAKISLGSHQTASPKVALPTINQEVGYSPSKKAPSIPSEMEFPIQLPSSSFLNSSPTKHNSVLSSSGPVSPIAKDSRFSGNNHFGSPHTRTNTHAFSHSTFNSAFSPTKRSFQKTTTSSSVSTPSSSYLRAAAEKGTPLCPIHELPVDILCTDCSELICAKCSRTPLHNIHSCKSIDELDRDKECRDVRASIEVLDSRITDLEIKSGSSHDIEAIQQLHAEAVEEIRKSFERAREILHEQEQDLISSLNLIIQSRIQLNTDISTTKQKIIQASAKLYPNDEMTNYDIAQNKYHLINSIKDKVEFLEIKLKFNGSCLDQDVQEIKEKGQSLMSQIDNISKHYDLPSYSFYPLLAKVGGRRSSSQ